MAKNKQTADATDAKSDKTVQDKQQDKQAAAAKTTESKGHPTPKRKDAQQATIRPLVPKDRKAAKKAAKAREREREDREYTAMETGDVAHMPTSERIPWRVYTRDYVDARYNLGEWFLVIMIIAMILILALQTTAPVVAAITIIVLYAYMLVVIIDLIVMWRGLKKKLVAKYGDRAVARGQHTGFYAWTRALQIRAWRLPKPRYAKHGNWPK